MFISHDFPISTAIGQFAVIGGKDCSLMQMAQAMLGLVRQKIEKPLTQCAILQSAMGYASFSDPYTLYWGYYFCLHAITM